MMKDNVFLFFFDFVMVFLTVLSFYNEHQVFQSFSLSVRPSRVVRTGGVRPSVPGGPAGGLQRAPGNFLEISG